MFLGRSDLRLESAWPLLNMQHWSSNSIDEELRPRNNQKAESEQTASLLGSHKQPLKKSPMNWKRMSLASLVASLIAALSAVAFAEDAFFHFPIASLNFTEG